MRTENFSRIDPAEFADYMKGCGEGAKVYLGCDSERSKIEGVYYADYILAVVVHLNGRHGCHLMAEIHRERDYDQKVDRPFNRMMTEARKVCELWERLKDTLLEYEYEIHLDISPFEKYGSNVAYSAATGYVKAMTLQDPVVKNDAWCASFAADRARELGYAFGIVQDTPQIQE